MKKYILAIYDKEFPTLPLPSEWQLLKAEDFSEGMKHIANYCPYLLLVKNSLKEERATDFLKEVGKRFGVIPPSMILGLNKDSEISDDEKSCLGIIASYCGEPNFKTILKEIEPLLKEPPLPRMTILEFLATLLLEKASGIYDFKIASSSFKIIAKNGKLECLVDEVFRATYRDLLSQGGLDLPPMEKEIQKDIANIERIPYAEKKKIKEIKQFAFLKVISGLPLNNNYKFTNASKEKILPDSLGVDISNILRKLVEEIPLNSVEIMKKCSFKKALTEEDLTKHIAITPEEGYLLHLVQGEVSYNEIKNLCRLNESVLLRRLYLLFLFGFISTNPSGGIPPRIQHLKDEVASKERLIFSQSLSIEQFSQTLQIPGLSPYKVLGIDEKATLVEAVESYRNLEHLFRPEELDLSVQKKFSKHLTFIRSKLTEAILLLESFHFNGKQRQQDAAASKMEQTERMGAEKTEVQQTEETRKKEAERIFAVAKEYFENDHIYEAGQYLKTALIYDPFSAPSRHLLAMTYMKMKDTKSKYMAERELKIAIENDPWNTTYILDLAKLYIEVNMPNRAKSLLEQAQRINPNDPEIKTVRDLLKKAN